MAWKPDYATLAEAKSFLRLADTLDDVEIALWITAASRAIDTKMNRQFGQEAAPVARTYRRPPAYDPTTGMWVLQIDDVQTTTGLLVAGIAYASSGWTLGPDNALTDQRPYTRLQTASQPYLSSPGSPQATTVTAQYGWTAVPAAVKGAVRLQLNRWNSRRDSPSGVAGSPDQGSEIRLLTRLDPDVITTLRGFGRPGRPG